MVKQRMSSADVAAEVACLRQRGIVGMRLANVYDCSPKVFILKFARSGDDGEKILLLIESGSRFHTVQAMPDKSDTPSNFTLKLRKHLRTRRLESITQLGVDRLVEFTFGTGEKTHRLILEFYAQGNLILADHKYLVLTLLRSHRDDAKGVAMMSRHTYPIQTVRLRQPVTLAALETALTTASSTVVEASGEKDEGGDAEVRKGVESSKGNKSSKKQQQKQANAAAGGESSSSVMAAPTLKVVLAELMRFGPMVAEHCILQANLNPDRDITQQPLDDQEKPALLVKIQAFEKWLNELEVNAPGGAILTSTKTTTNNTDSLAADKNGSAVVYEEFEPLLENNTPFEQHTHRSLITFPTFDDAISEFFGRIQGQRTAAQQAQREKAALGKLEAIKKDHTQRLDALSREVALAEHKASLIEQNLDLVDAAIASVKEALEGGMDWADLARLIKDEKKAGNPVAGLIDSLQLDARLITLVLPDNDYYDDEETYDSDKDISDTDSDDEGVEAEQERRKKKQSGKGTSGSGNQKSKYVKVDVHIDFTAYANARRHYDARRKHSDKQRRTLEANEKALKAAEKRAMDQLIKVKANAPSAAAAGPARKPHWFEKFNWFISSENYLVIAGRDAQQNEMLVKKYMKKGDVYVHADLHGAASVIIKNNDMTKPIPPLTLFQAGQACVCRSAAWSAKIVASAWWVHPEQVSKTAPTGEYLTTGSFIIRGRKNYLPPQPLVMGLGFLFRLDESCIAGHLGERAPRGLGDDEDEGGGVSTAGTSSRQQTNAAAMLAAMNLQDDDDVETTKSGNNNEKGGGPKDSYEAFMEASYDNATALASKGRQDSNSIDAVYERYGLENAPSGSGGGATATNNKQQKHAVLEIEDDDDDIASRLIGESSSKGGGNRRHLSAKERQLRKKGISIVGPEAEISGLLPGKSKKGGGGGGASTVDLGDKPQQYQKARGKNAKGKKVKQRYQDQDEEDREIAMQLLQPAGQKKDRKQRKAERKERMAARKAVQTGLPQRELTEEEIAALTAKPSQTLNEKESDSSSDDSDDNSEGQGTEQSIQKEGEASAKGTETTGDDGHVVTEQQVRTEKGVGDNQHTSDDNDDDDDSQEAEDDNEDTKDDGEEAMVASDDEDEEIAALLASENIVLLGEGQKVSPLDALTGCPREGDTLMYAIPVCAPYAVLGNYKHRVKLVPGPLKKGKAGRQCVELLMREAAGREKDLIKGVPEQELINAVVGGVRLQVAGLQKLQKIQRGQKKKKK